MSNTRKPTVIHGEMAKGADGVFRPTAAMHATLLSEFRRMGHAGAPPDISQIYGPLRIREEEKGDQ